MSIDGYQRTQTMIAAPRDAEYLAFTKATRRLIDANVAGDDDLKAMIAAIHSNRQLWAALASDCARTENQLPEEARALIIGLARWVSAHSTAVMRKTESIEALIEVNRMMMDGLSGKAPQG